MISIYKASAGSGKTYTLAYQYIKMLLGRQLERSGDYRLSSRRANRHRSILAITFTNKATEEMKHRIIHELAVLAGTEPGWTATSPYLDDLCRDLRAPADDIAAEARRALSEILFDYGRFSVSTIDAFFQQVLRTFAREADQTGNYEVDLDDSQMIRLALARLFRSISYASPEMRVRALRTKEWILRFCRDKMMKGERFNILNRSSSLFGQLADFVGKALDETFNKHYDAMMAYLARPGVIERLAEGLGSIMVSVTESVGSAARAAHDALEALDPAIVNSNALSAFRKFTGDIEKWELPATLVKIADDPSAAIKKGTRKAEKLLSASIQADTALMGRISEGARSIVAAASTMATAGAVSSNIYYLGLLADIIREMGEVRRENNTILLSDTNLLLRKIIGSDETPFLYERMGVRLEHFLIDEFQDTSRMQWENLKPLLAEGLATDRDSLIIGDEKQCIYRFRDSDPSLLQSGVASDFPLGSGEIASGRNTNWRSSSTVVEFNNSFFAAAAADLSVAFPAGSGEAGFNDIYHNVVQDISPAHKEHQGYVDIALTESREDGYDRAIDEIARQINDGGYRPADIAVLFRRRKEATEFIDRLLRRRAADPAYPSFSIISDESISVGSSPAVKLIVSSLRSLLLLRPAAGEAAEIESRRRRSHTLDEEVLACLVNDFEFFAHAMSPSEALARAVDLACNATPADPRHAPLIDSRMVCPNLTSLVDRIITLLIDEPSLRAEHAFVSAFQDIVAEYSARNGSDLPGFISWWDAKGAFTAVSSRRDEQSLRVMTIHKSKGLEFKCVHIPAADWDMAKLTGPEWFEIPEGSEILPGLDPALLPPIIPLKIDRKLADGFFGPQYCSRLRETVLDELNTLYVAFTRAIDELSVSFTISKGEKSGKLIDSIISRLGQGSADRFTLGSPTTRRADRAKAATALEPKGASVTIPPVIPADAPALWSRTRLDTPVTDPFSAPLRGIMLHDILARVTRVDDLPRAVRSLTGIGRLSSAEAPEIERMLAGLLDDPRVKPWFDGFTRVMMERPIATGPKGSDRRRPDRVVWTADGHIDIIDYKSGQEHLRSHSRQVAAYMKQLTDLGYTDVRGFVWYLDTGIIHPVKL